MLIHNHVSEHNSLSWVKNDNVMLKINRQSQSLSTLNAPSLSDVSISERYHLQEYIANSPEAFFRELGLELFLIGKEVEPSPNVQDRIDLLAVDREGRCVIVELKRGNNKLQMFQAISYAGMISKWEPDDFLRRLDGAQRESLVNFLEVEIDDINRQQSIVLIAEAYDYALLVGAEWLSEQHVVDITCCRIGVSLDAETGSEYLVCSNVYPAPELVNQAISRGRKSGNKGKTDWSDWQTALAGIGNPAVVSYVEKEITANRESYLPKRILRYRIGGKRRWFLAARNKNAYVWQQGRFDGDIEYWRKGLGNPDVVKPVKNEMCLRLFLDTNEDFKFFYESATSQLLSARWLEDLPDDDVDDAEDSSDE
jgi:hypothetical protein